MQSNFVGPSFAEAVRAPLRFARKHTAAQLLSARLFGGDVGLEEIMHEIKGSALWKAEDKTLIKIADMSTHHLQQWVRLSFLSDPIGTPQLQNFISSLVRPCLRVSVSSVPENMHEIMAKFSAVIQGGQAEEEYVAALKVACSCVSGELSNHPLVMGLALQCKRLCDKQARGLESMVGRRSSESQVERDLISHAGLSLALAGANYSLAKSFGLASTSLRIDLDHLKKFSLPSPALSILWPDVLESNFELLNQRFVQEQGAPQRFLADLGSFLS